LTIWRRRTAAGLQLLRGHARQFDGFLSTAPTIATHGGYFDLARDKMHIVPLGIDLGPRRSSQTDFRRIRSRSAIRANLSEKGLHSSSRRFASA